MNKTVIKFFWKIGISIINRDVCIFTLKNRGELVIVDVYVDNLLLGSGSYNALEWLKDELTKEFQIKDLGKAKMIIGCEIIRDLEARTLKIDQKEYIWDLLEAEEMTLCYPTILPIKAGLFIFMNQAGNDSLANLVAY